MIVTIRRVVLVQRGSGGRRVCDRCIKMCIRVMAMRSFGNDLSCPRVRDAVQHGQRRSG